MKNFRLKIINTIARVKQQKNKLANNFVLLFFYGIYAGIYLGILYLFLFLVSLPFHIVWSPTKSFDFLTPRDEKGQYLGSYNRHILVYRTSVATTLTAVLVIFIWAVSTFFVSGLALWPWRVEAASCTSPTVTMSVPSATTYKNATETFDMTGSWNGGGACVGYTYLMYWQYCTCSNSSCGTCSSYADIEAPGSGTPMTTAGSNPTSTNENSSYTNTITAVTAGCYKVKLYLFADAPFIPKSSTARNVVIGAPTKPTNFTHSTNTTSTITWSWTDADISEANFYVHDSSHNSMTGSVSGNGGTTTSQESSLSANTQYTRHANAYSTNGSTDSDPASVYTSIEAPSSITFNTVAATAITVSATGSFSNLASGSSGLYFAESATSTNSGWIQTNSWEKTGLTKNTQYSYTVKARNGDSDETSTTGVSTKYTLAADASVSASIATSTWTNSVITFTNNAGFGGGGVQYYRYILDQSATHVWTDSETQWSASTLQLTPTSDANNWYLHVKAYNGDGTAAASNATQDLGPYYYDATAPTPNPSTGSASADSTTQITWTFSATTDATSSLAASPYSFDNGGSWQASTTYVRNTLTANTEYIQNLKAKDTTGNTTTAGAVSKYTLSKAPGASSVSADKSPSTWYNTSIFTFTNNDGFGEGGVKSYKVAWDQSATHVWDDTEDPWTTGTRILNASSEGSWYLHVKGYNGDGVANGTYDYGPYYFDATAPTPNPSTGSAAADSTIQITWTINSATDSVSGLPASPYSFDNGSTWQIGTTYVRNSLTANTQYTQTLKAKDTAGNQTTAGTVNKYTLSKAPGASSVSADKSPSTWYSTSTFTFTNNDGFGGGGVQYYRYVWDQSATHTWVGTETQWTTGTKALTTSAEGSWYLHVKGYNGDDVANETYDYGPYYFDETNPTITNNQSGDDTWRNAAGTTYNVTFSNGGSGAQLDYAQYAVGTTQGTTDILDWTNIFTTDINSYTTPWSVNFSSLQEGTNYVSFKTCDTAGNCNTVLTDGFYIRKDTVPAVVSNINVSPDLSSATVTWATDEGATSQIEWGATDTYGNFTALDSNLATTHTKTVSSLTAGQTYHFRVVAEDRATNETLSSDQTFATSTLPATTISNVSVTNLSTTSVKVTWSTNQAATSKVRYGLTTAYGQEVSDNNLVTSHEITITGLLAGKTYHYEVMSQGNTYAYDADATFTTSEEPASEPEPEPQPEPAPTPTPSVLAAPTVVYPKDDETSVIRRPVITGLARSNNTIFIFIDSNLENTVLSSNHPSGTGSFYYKLRRDLSIGTHTLYTIARNSDGVYSAESPEITFEVKLPYIAPTLLAPVEKEAVTEDGEIVIPGLAANDSTIKVYIDGILFDSFQVENNISGTANFAYVLDLSKLSAGQHSVYMIAYDKNGFASLKSESYTFYKNGVYTVKSGDSLWKIAEVLLGNGRLYNEIVEANKNTYPSLENNPSLILPGWILQIP